MIGGTGSVGTRIGSGGTLGTFAGPVIPGTVTFGTVTPGTVTFGTVTFGAVVVTVVVTFGGAVVVVVGLGVVVAVTVLMTQSGQVVVVTSSLVVVVEVVLDGGGGGGGGGLPGQLLADGSGWPVSQARTYDRPCASAKYEPMSTGCWGIALMETLIGFCPVCNRSSTPGLPTYLQTNTLRSSGLSRVVAFGSPHAARRMRAAAAPSAIRI